MSDEVELEDIYATPARASKLASIGPDVRRANGTKAPKVPAWKTPAARALQLGGRGVRISLGIDTLDKACRGGVLTGKVVIIGGAPGSGKTTLVTDKGFALARRGIWTAILAADEDADGLLIRIGQNENLSREDLENGNEAARKALAQRLEPLPLLLFDSDEDEITVEVASAELAKMAKGALSVLIVDSVQTVRCEGTGDADGPRARADAVMLSLKRAAKRDKHLVIGTSEVSRGWYKSAADRIDPLAAFKESGGIEYGAALAVAMLNVKGEEGLVDVVVAKNRMGQKTPFRLKLNFARARFEEVPLESDDPTPVDEDEREAAQIDKARGRILHTLAQVSTLTSMTQVCKRSRGNKAANLKAFKELDIEKLIVQIDGFWRPSPGTDQGVPKC